MQVNVGIGTLAGSTIMLLTVAWGGSLLAGRCDLDEKVSAGSRDATLCKCLSDMMLRMIPKRQHRLLKLSRRPGPVTAGAMAVLMG